MTTPSSFYVRKMYVVLGLSDGAISFLLVDACLTGELLLITFI